MASNLRSCSRNCTRYTREQNKPTQADAGLCSILFLLAAWMDARRNLSPRDPRGKPKTRTPLRRRILTLKRIQEKNALHISLWLLQTQISLAARFASSRALLGALLQSSSFRQKIDSVFGAAPVCALGVPQRRSEPSVILIIFISWRRVATE